MVKKGVKIEMYKFVYYNFGWWLEILNISDYNLYLKNTIGINCENILFNSVSSAIKFDSGKNNMTINEEVLGGTVHTLSKIQNVNYIDAAYDLFMNNKDNQMKELYDGNIIYINKNNGWFMQKKAINHSLYVYRSDLEFPSYVKDDIYIDYISESDSYVLYIGDCVVNTKFGHYFKDYTEALELGEIIVSKEHYKLSQKIAELTYYGIMGE